MSLSTYSGLAASVADWLHRADLGTPIVDFIALAHKQLMRDLRGHVRLMVRNASFPISGEYVAAPNDFLEFVSGYLNDSTMTPLVWGSADAAKASGTAQISLVSGPGGTEDFHFEPAVSAMTATIEYYAKLPVLSASATTNWILDDHPDLYLYGALLQSTAYLGDDPRIGLWQAAYASALESCKAAGKRARWSGPNLQMRVA
jgi:hypothetical protein